MQKLLTDKFVQGIKGTGKLQRFADTLAPNLMLKVQPTGTKVWVWSGRVDGKMTEKTLGRYPALDLADAREQANELTVRRDTGGEVTTLKEARQEAERKKEVEQAAAAFEEQVRSIRTCQWLFELYMEHDGGAKKTAAEKWRVWNVDIKPVVGHMPVEDVDHNILMDIITAKHKVSPISARNLVAHIKRTFRWAVTHGRHLTKMTVNPAVDLFKIAPKAERKRFLNEFEIACFFEAVAEMGTSAKEGLILVAYTGVRQQECFAAKWKEFDLTKGYWIIPADRTKNGVEHLVPLPATMLSLVKALKAGQKVKSDFLFPQDSDPTQCRPKTSFSNIIESMNIKTARIAAKKQPGVEVEHFTIHDLRRTMVSHMNGMLDDEDEPMIPQDIVERCVNHTITGVAGTYNRHAYLKEKKRAFRLWAEQLNKIRGINVVEIAQAA
ncbi:tyrosine-type recombinase/integrase [Sphingobium sp. MK2]|uniref:tyrosine-type recombinase/integrase n=1 Tax=Sphingobium sp. MK2 TaxID=3116540 RepID=UPI0032E35A9C